MDSIRIIQLPTKSDAGTDDYIAVDSTANGTKKIQFPNLLDDGLTIQNKAADAKATGDAINGVNSAIGNEASTRQSADANLQTQIDQLIAPSGEAPSAAEIENARIGAPPENTVYPTLGDAIRGQVTDLKSDINNIVETLADGGVHKAYLWDSYNQGVVHNGSYSNPVTSDTTTVYGRLFSVNTEEALNVDVAAGYKVLIVYYENDGTLPAVSSWLTGNNVVPISSIPSGKTKFCIEVRTINTTAITPSDATGKVEIYYPSSFDYYNKEDSDEILLPIKQYLGMASPSSIYTLDYQRGDSNTRIYSSSVDKLHSLAFVERINVSAVSGFLTSIAIWDGVTFASSTPWASGSTYQNDDSQPYYAIMAKKSDDSTISTADLATFASSVQVTAIKKVINTDRLGAVYVSTAGSDSNDGTEESPFATIQKAVDSGANRIIVSSGTYIGSVNISNKVDVSIEVADYTDNVSISEKPKIVLNATGQTNGISVRNVGHVSIRDMEIYGADHALIRAVNVRNMECENVVVHDNTRTYFLYSGFELLNVTGRFVNCLAYNIDRDGFNLHGVGHTEFIDCIAHDCNDDGISHHEICTGTVRGGEYYRCNKGGISSPYDHSRVNVEGVYTHDNNLWGIMAGAAEGECYGNISNCVSKNNGGKDIKIYGTDSRLYGWNNIYDTKEVDDVATFVEFN